MMKFRLKEAGAAKMLGALGNRTRLRLYRLLVRAGSEGLNVGEIQTKLALPASTLAHHLTALVRSGLVTQTRQGREVRSSVNYHATHALVHYLTEACCADADLNALPLITAFADVDSPQTVPAKQGSNT